MNKSTEPNPYLYDRWGSNIIDLIPNKHVFYVT